MRNILKTKNWLGLSVLFVSLSILGCGEDEEEEKTDGTEMGIVANDMRESAAATRERSYHMTQFIKSTDVDDDEYFGVKTAVHGNVLAVMKRYSLEIFRKDANGIWVFEEDFEKTYSSGFGASVDVGNDVIVVGAPSEEVSSAASAGKIYVYTYASGAWSESATLTAASPEASDQLGYSVAVNAAGDVVAAGLVGRTSYTGQALIFRKTSGTWAIDATYNGSATVDYMGYSVAVNAEGTVVAISAPYYAAANTGQIYIYRYASSSWTLEETLDGVSGTTNYLGHSLSMSGNVLAAGTAYGAGSFSVYRYASSAWTAETTAQRVSGFPGDYFFGGSISVDGDRLIVGDFNESMAGTSRLEDGTYAQTSGAKIESESGAAYTFVYNSDGEWEQDGYLKAPNANSGDRFAASVAASNGTFFVGSQQESSGSGSLILNDNSVQNSGAVYVFEKAYDGSRDSD